MGRGPGALRRLVARRSAELRKVALSAGGEVEPGALAALERLARLQAVEEAAARARRRGRWPVAIALVTTLAILSVLLFTRVGRTEIDLRLQATAAAFRLAATQTLTRELLLAELGASGLAGLRLPRLGRWAREAPDAELAGGLAVHLAPARAGTREGGITLGALVLPEGAEARIAPRPAGGGYRLSLDGLDEAIEAAVVGSIRIGSAGRPPTHRVFASPKTVAMTPGPGMVDLDLGFEDGTRPLFAPQIAVSELHFSRVHERAAPQRTVVRRVSTVASGSLYFEDLGGRERPLRPGERLALEIERGELASIELVPGGVALRFHGMVSALRAGSGGMSLMPTRLEWLQAQHGLSLLWGSTLYCFGVLAALRRWWRAEP